MTADPFQGSADSGNPGTWNRYFYGNADPINHTDPTGLMAQIYVDGVASDIGYFGGSILSTGGATSDRIGGMWCDQGSLFFISSPAQCAAYAGAVWFAATRPRNDNTLADCDLIVFQQSAVIEHNPLQHTFIMVQRKKQSPVYIEGIPEPKVEGAGLRSASWLNKSVRLFGHQYSTAASVVSNGAFRLSDEQCQRIVNLAGGYKDNTVTYNNTWFFSGPNSNSFTHSLLQKAGLFLSLSNNFYPGWANTSVPF